MIGSIFTELEEWLPYLLNSIKELPLRIAEVLREPSRDPKLTVIIVVLMLILLLLVSSFVELAMSFLMSDRKTKKVLEKDQDDDASGDELKSSRRFLKTRLVIVLFLLVLLGSGVHALSSSTLCGSCHAMSASYASWKNSRHAKSECISCHQRPGLIGFTASKADLFRMVARSVGGGYARPVRAPVLEQNCVSCHRSVTVKTIVRAGIRVSHKELVAAGYGCGECHLAHGKGVISRSMMGKCASCHNGVKASVDCSTCHTKDPGTASAKLADEYPKVHLSSGNCKGCHDTTASCDSCHGIEMPHPAGWQEGSHAKSAAFEKKQLCRKCHQDSFCGKCHRFPGHPADWESAHKADRSAEKGCMSCHLPERSPQFCALCHSEGEKLKTQ